MSNYPYHYRYRRPAREGRFKGRRFRLRYEGGVEGLTRLGMAAGLIFVMFFLGSRVFSRGMYGIFINGKKVATLKTKNAAEKVMMEVLKTGSGANFKDKVGIRRVRLEPGEKILTVQEAVMQLLQGTSLEVAGAVLMINNKPVLAMDKVSSIQEVLEEVKSHYRSKVLGVPKNIYFKETRSFQERPVARGNLKTKEQSMQILTHGTEKMTTHTVQKGEMGWNIARRYGISVKKLALMNPKANVNRLRAGMKLLAPTMLSPLTVVIETLHRAEETIPYTVETKRDSSLFQDTTKVVSEGRKGLREVTYMFVYENGKEVKRIPVSVRELKSSQSRIIVKGTKIRPSPITNRMP